MNINEATMSVNIAGVPRPFRIITKDQGKKEYGAPFYEEVTKGVKSLAEKIKAENPDTRTARGWVKAAFEQLGVEPVGQAGFLTQLMRFKDAAAMAEALYDITVDDEGNQSTVVGEAELHEKQAVYAESWARQSEDERAEHLTKAGYDGDELAAYKKFDWDNLPPAVRTHVEVVLEGTGYNGGTAGLRMGMNPKYRTDAPNPEEKPADEEPADEEPADEEPAEEEPAEEEPKDAVFENQAEYNNYFRKMAGLTEAEPSAGEVPKGSGKDTPEVEELVRKAQAGDKEAIETLLLMVQDTVWANVHKGANLYGGLSKAEKDEVFDAVQMDVFSRQLRDYKIGGGRKFNSWVHKLSGQEVYKRIKKLLKNKEQSGDASDDEGKTSLLKVAQAFAQLNSSGMPPECQAAVEAVMSRLDPKHRKVVQLLMGIGYTPKDLRDEIEAGVKELCESDTEWDSQSEVDRAARLTESYTDSNGVVKIDAGAVVRYSQLSWSALPIEVRAPLKGFPPSLGRKLGDHRVDEFEVVSRDIAPLFGVTHTQISNWLKQAVGQMRDADEFWACKDAIAARSGDRDSEDKPGPAFRRAGRKPGSAELFWSGAHKEALDPFDGNPSDVLSDFVISILSEAESAELVYPSELVAKNMEEILVCEGVKIKRKGKKITIPVNEYPRAKKAFEKAGLTIPKKYVSHEADNIRKMASFSGQYGGGVDSLS